MQSLDFSGCQYFSNTDMICALSKFRSLQCLNLTDTNVTDFAGVGEIGIKTVVLKKSNTEFSHLISPHYFVGAHNHTTFQLV